jgi:transmembrane sensor
VNKSKIDKLIVKLFENSLTADESTLLEEWLKEDSNKIYFNELVEINYLINSKSQFDYKTSLEKFQVITKNNQSIKYKQYLKYAAAVLIFISAGYFISNDLVWVDKNETKIQINVVESQIKIGTDKATLTLEDGSVIALQKGNNYQTKTAQSNGEKIIYNAGKQNSSKIAFNYLTIPRGGQFHLVLSDGTEVWLNSETQLKFPVAFQEGNTRQVELVYGEAYFDVSPSTKHKGSKFKVLNQSQEVEVVGTEFNIKAYKDEANVFTTLVEGKVDVKIANTKQRLLPNQQLNLALKSNVSVINTVDVYNEISWKDGVFSFERKPLKEIMKVLSRWYDVKVVLKNKSLEDVKFFGVLGKNQSITEILEIIKKFEVIESYEIKDKVIILK